MKFSLERFMIYSPQGEISEIAFKVLILNYDE